jgi:NurA-like 5'-3' nuclease
LKISEKKTNKTKNMKKNNFTTTINDEEIKLVKKVTKDLIENIHALAPVRIYICKEGEKNFKYTSKKKLKIKN